MLFTTVGLRNSAFDGRKRRLDPRPGPFAFQAFDQARFFAADVCRRAAMQENIERKVAAENVLAEIACRVALVDRRLQPIPAQRVFEAQIKVGRRRPGREAAEDDPFDHLMRIVFHQDAVIERARLALVGVDAHVDRAGMVLGQEGPLQPGRESPPRRGRAVRWTLTISITCAGVISFSALRSAW